MYIHYYLAVGANPAVGVKVAVCVYLTVDKNLAVDVYPAIVSIWH